jgi:uncharacterized protein (DUF1330 family)
VAKGYWIATYRSIKDQEALDAYAKLTGAAIGGAGGRVIVRGRPARTFEDGLDLRTVIIEFESVASAVAAYESPKYQAARKVLGNGAVRDIRVVEGHRIAALSASVRRACAPAKTGAACLNGMARH